MNNSISEIAMIWRKTLKVIDESIFYLNKNAFKYNKYIRVIKNV